MTDFIAAQDRALLEQYGLASFDALWALQLEAVDEPNTERGGWSSVYRLDLGEAAFYLKRQALYALADREVGYSVWIDRPPLGQVAGQGPHLPVGAPRGHASIPHEERLRGSGQEWRAKRDWETDRFSPTGIPGEDADPGTKPTGSQLKINVLLEDACVGACFSEFHCSDWSSYDVTPCMDRC